VPFGCLALAVLVAGGWQAGGWRRWAAVASVVVVALAFAWFYPLYAAVPLGSEQVEQRMVWESWRYRGAGSAA